MCNIIVSLISDQTIPNVLFIKEMETKKKDIKLYLFISTNKMEQKGKANSIIQASNIDKSKTKVIEVIEDSIEDITTKLTNFAQENLNSGDNYIINLTGGTKIMSIGVYNFFKDKNRNSIYYLPIGKNTYKQIFPSLQNGVYDLNFRISIEEYLTSYGFEIIHENKILKAVAYTESFFKKFMENKIEMRLIKELRRERDKKKIQLNEEMMGFLKEINFITEKESILNKKEIEYLTGGWFEEYVYTLIQKHIQLEDNKIGLNIHISQKETQNEFDVMFVHKNTLYIIECKTSLKDNNKNLMNDTLYKLYALKNDFGLIVNGYLFTLDSDLRDNNNQIKDSYQNRANLMNIKLIDRKILSDENKLNEIFDKIKGVTKYV